MGRRNRKKKRGTVNAAPAPAVLGALIAPHGRADWSFLTVTTTYLGGALLCWVLLAGAYGAGSTPVKESPLYNEPKDEELIAFVVCPAMALLWPLWFRLVGLRLRDVTALF